MIEFVSFLIGYFFGAIPFGLLVTKLTNMGDIRAIGSGNIGATNVLRTGSKKLAALTLLGDLLKGTFAVLLAGLLFSLSPYAGLLAAAGAVIGHCYPLWLKFKGGKGVATYLGTLLGLKPIFAIGFAIIWLLVFFFTRLSSLSALTAAFLIPIGFLIFSYHKLTLLYFALTALLYYRHKDNIKRLISGQEPRFESKSQPKDS